MKVLIITTILSVVFLLMVKDSPKEPEIEPVEGPGIDINGHPVLETFHQSHDPWPLQKLVLTIYAMTCALFIAPLVIFGVGIPWTVIMVLVVMFFGCLMWMSPGSMNLTVWASSHAIEFRLAGAKDYHSRHIIKIGSIERMELVKMSLLFSQGYSHSAFEVSKSRAVMYVDGNQAIKITMINGTRIFVSLDEPEKLIAHVRKIMSENQ